MVRRNVDVDFLPLAKVDAIVGIHEQIIGNLRPGGEGGLCQLRRRHRDHLIGQLHHAVDGEMAARGVRCVVIEVIRERVVVGIARTEQR
jgi:hypothetical protein